MKITEHKKNLWAVSTGKRIVWVPFEQTDNKTYRIQWYQEGIVYRERKPRWRKRAEDDPVNSQL